jgi:multiple sugar transport system ATP-binding protein
VARVAFHGVSKRFGSVVAVDDLTLEVADGEFMVLVGPSGSGKTTALRMLAGLEALGGGRVEIGDRVVNDVSARDRDVAMVFQDYALYPQMTVYDNMAFGLRRRRMPRSEIERRVTGASDALGIGDLLARRPRELSGGQQQRVALGRALVREPRVFLMDEPLSNLDAQLRAQARGEIKRLQRDVGTTTVYVTHDQVEAMTLGDRIAVMNAGRLEQVGTPDELYERPANVFVGGFIGSPAMSFLQRDGVLFGVRPEHVRAWRDDAGLVGPLEGHVAYVEALGRETFVGVDVEGGARLVAAVEGWARVRPGDTVRLGLVADGLRRFDPDDGTALPEG